MRIAGVDIGGTYVKVGLVDTARGLLDKTSFPTPLGDPQAMAGLIARQVREMDASAVGIGSAGSVRLDTGLVYAGNLDWWGVPLRKLVEERLHMPVWVDNDAQAALMAEVFDGALQGVKNAVYLTLGTGVGGALLLDGRPWRGGTNTAAELGHMITHGDGLPCRCTRKGCYEMYASGSALSRMAGGLEIQEIFERAQAGDYALSALLEAYYHEIGIGLVSLISIFNPDRIALGGGVSAAGDALLDGVTKDVHRQLAARSDYFQGHIVLAAHKNEAGMIGAAILAQYYLFPDSI